MTSEAAMTDLTLLSPGIDRWATLSDDRRYRYQLGRRWGTPWAEGGRRVLWIMLNPSTADADADDPTIRRCIGFSRAWGYDELVVVNLYALRATDPAELGRAEDPFGPDNATWLDHHLSHADSVIAAWGAHNTATNVADALLLEHRPLRCLGTTKDGHPRHPLYVRADQPLEVWRA